MFVIQRTPQLVQGYQFFTVRRPYVAHTVAGNIKLVLKCFLLLATAFVILALNQPQKNAIENEGIGTAYINKEVQNISAQVSKATAIASQNTLSLHFELLEEQVIDITIFDILGGECTKLIDAQVLKAGAYNKKFNIENLKPGTYLCSFTLGNTKTVKKIIKT